MSVPVGVVMRRAAELAARRKDRSNERKRALRQVQREAYPTVVEMVAEAKQRPHDPLTALVCLLADLPNHLAKAEAAALPRKKCATASDRRSIA